MVLGPIEKESSLPIQQIPDLQSLFYEMLKVPIFLSVRNVRRNDKIEKAKGYKHMTFREAATLARDAKWGNVADPLQSVLWYVRMITWIQYVRSFRRHGREKTGRVWN